MEALGGREFDETLLVLATKVRTLRQSSLAGVTKAAESLMIRHYRRIGPAGKPGVLVAMEWLTTAVFAIDRPGPPVRRCCGYPHRNQGRTRANLVLAARSARDRR